MKIFWQLRSMVFICWCYNANAQGSAPNAISFNSGILRQVASRILTPSSENARNIRLADRLNILQPKIKDDVLFPCALNNSRSQQRPTSVHTLRPGDIDVVAAIGDSLIAGNGLLATNVLQVYIQNRGISAFIGGQDNWRRYLTLPNILKEYNPSLIGYSVKDTINNPNDSQLNVAEGSVKSKDIPSMATQLIQRMKNYPINIEEDWKMITVMVGANDFCDEICKLKNPADILETHRKNLFETLRILRDNLPRTIVNLVLVPRPSVITQASRQNKPLMCYITQPLLCPCLFDTKYRNQYGKYNEIMLKWQDVEAAIANDPEFDRNDFTVVLQPFTRDYSLPTTRNGLTDYSALSQDCFHISQKEGARAALSLWNNLLEPARRKSTTPGTLYRFRCPTLENPYIFTRRNSVAGGK